MLPKKTAETSRRTLLRAVGAGAGAGLFAVGSVGTVVASEDADGSDLPVSPDCECYYEFNCNTDLLCEDPSIEYPNYYESRECCECSDGTVCDDWQSAGCCRG